jgi:hypothetical protein
MKKKLMINMGRWGLGTYPERRHLRTCGICPSAYKAYLPLAKKRRTLRCLVTTNRRDPDSTLHRLDTMGSLHIKIGQQKSSVNAPLRREELKSQCGKCPRAA